MISSGDAAWPDREMTNFSRSLPVLGSAVDDGGSVDGRGRYVYGRGVAVGKEMNGETVKGIWARRGCDPSGMSAVWRLAQWI